MNILRHPAVIIVLILLVVLLFGSRRLPDLARSVGQSLKIFKKEVKELKDDGTEAGAGDDAGAEQPSDDATPGSGSSATPSSASPPSTTAATPAAQDGASQQVPGLADPQQPRA